MSQSLVSQQPVDKPVDKPVDIFISYSRHDRQYADELLKHLRIGELSGRIRVWYDGNLNPGQEWEAEICSQFRSAKIILLLISPDFFASDYCIRREMPEAMKRHAAQDAQVVPVIVRPVEWQRSVLAKLNVLPQNSKPIDEWDSRDQYYLSVTKSLFEQVDALFPSPDTPVSIWDSASKVDLSTVEAPAVEAPTARMEQPDVRPSAKTEGPAPVIVVPTMSAAEEYRAAVKAFVPEIVVCFLHRERRQKLLKLRKLFRNPSDACLGDLSARVVESSCLEDAVQRVTASARETILLLDGFEPGCQQLDEVLESVPRQRRLNVIVNASEWEHFAAQQASASILQTLYTITSDEMLLSTLRKALLRVRTREFASAGVIDTKEELEAFFRLRFRVWDELGYLSEAKRSVETPWELDYTDRTSLPLGIFSKIDGALIGGARLVRGLGEEYGSMINTITEMLQEQNAKCLLRNFDYPTFATHPFDILGELQRFQEYYRDLVRRRVSKAEVSRVVVDPDYRKLGLGEVIVDTLCSLARLNAVEVLFLACHTKHIDFYARSQFNVVGGVAGNNFLTYRVPCVAMERQLS